MSAKTKEAVVKAAMYWKQYYIVAHNNVTDPCCPLCDCPLCKLYRACHAHAKTTKPKGKL